MKRLIVCCVAGLLCITFAFYLFFPKKQITSHHPSPTITPTPSPIPLSSVKLPIVMFHYVEDVQDPKDIKRIKMDVSPFILNLQMKALQDNAYDTYFVRDIPPILDSGRSLKNKSIVLTFDDGYIDFYRNVFPLLKKYKLKATAYIIYNFIGKKGFMSLAQIHEIIDSGLVEVASHSMNHPSLESLSHKEAKKEVVESKKSLEETFGISVVSFAYPAGAYNQETLKIVQDAGYKIAVTTHPGITVTKNNIFEVPRIRPGSLTPTFIENYFEKFLFN